MNLRIPFSLAAARGMNGRQMVRMTLVVAAVALLAATVGCSQNASDAPAGDYGATVEALLPTAEPTLPPTLTPTPVPPTDTPAPTNTPRPQPTYTPRPAPTLPTTESRHPAISFDAQMLDGSEFSLPDSYGSPTLLAFWAPW